VSFARAWRAGNSLKYGTFCIPGRFLPRRGTKGPCSMQMSMHKLSSHTILQNYPLWCCCHIMYKLLYPSIRVRTAPPVSVRVSFGVMLLRILFCMCPKGPKYGMSREIRNCWQPYVDVEICCKWQKVFHISLQINVFRVFVLQPLLMSFRAAVLHVF